MKHCYITLIYEMSELFWNWYEVIYSCCIPYHNGLNSYFIFHRQRIYLHIVITKIKPMFYSWIYSTTLALKPNFNLLQAVTKICFYIRSYLLDPYFFCNDLNFTFFLECFGRSNAYLYAVKIHWSTLFIHYSHIILSMKRAFTF